jgi:DNA-binding transcriptional regulator YiaG
MNTHNPVSQQPFEVLIPTMEGDAIAERVQIQVPMEWDADLGEFLLTPEAHALIDDTKARYMGLMLPAQIKAVRQRQGIPQRQMSELIQAGEKSWTRWENGQARPSRVINVLLRAIDEGQVTVEWLQSLRNRNFSWSRAVGSVPQAPRVVSFLIKSETDPQLPQLEPNYETLAAAA